MSLPDSKELLRLIRKSRLLNSGELDQIRRRAAAGESSQQIVGSLSDDGLLTAWQCSQLMKRQTGFILDKYRLLNPVGRGGMGHVFRARDDSTGQIVAVKVMARKLSSNEVLVNRFRREIKAASQLNSPHVVRAVDAGRVGKVDFMVMEYVNGDQLDRIAGRVGRLPTGLACEIIRQAALGLQHAHDKRMVHRDVKPSNLIVDWNGDGEGTVKIMDLGLVRLESEPEEAKSVTRTGQVMGTPDFMSPEQAWDTTRADIRSDIYSLGCALFRLVSGQVPFPGDNPLQVLMARCSRDVPDIRTVCPDTEAGVQEIIARMTRRDPGQRFQAPGEVAAALEPYSEKLTRRALRVAMRNKSKAGDPAESGETRAQDDTAEDDDARYQQFLSEMEAGAAVDMVLSDSTATPVPDPITAPESKSIADLVPEQKSYAARDRDRRQQNLPWTWIGAGSVVALVVIGVAMTQIPRQLTGEDNPPQAVDQETAEPPEAVFAPLSPVTVRAGESASFRVTYSLSETAVDGTTAVRLSDDAPQGVEFDTATNTVSWTPSRLLSPGRYSFRLSLDWHSKGQQQEIASVPVEFVVQPGSMTAALQQPDPQRLAVNQSLELDLAADGFDAAAVGAVYQITEGALSGMAIDPASGILTWQATAAAVGRHVVQVALVDQQSQASLATASVRIMVIPTMISLQLPEFPVQQVVAGERFELALPSRQPQMLRRMVQLKLADPVPEGIALNPDSSRLVWDIPAEQDGRVEVQLVAEPVSAEVQFAPDSRVSTTIVFDVQSRAVSSMQPSDAEVNTAEQELRTLFRRELAAARSTSARTQLAVRLLEQSLEQDAGASDFALLNLITELADRGNAWEVLLEAEQLRHQRYQSEEFEAAVVSLQRLRRNGLSPLQTDLIVEHCLRLAASAAAEQKFDIVVELLRPADMLVRNSAESGGVRRLVTDVEKSLELAVLLSESDDVDSQPLVVGELQRLLDTWQFQDLFTAAETMSFLRTSDTVTPLVDSGRSLWTFRPGHLKMQSAPLNGLTGFLETARKPQRFVVRCSVAPRTNSLSFIVGAIPGAELSAFLVVLDDTGFGRIQQLPGPTKVRDPPSSVPLSTTGPNLVEIIGDGRQLTLRVNGSQLYSSRMPRDVTGHLGIMSSLVRAEPGAVVDIRRPRVLILPDGE